MIQPIHPMLERVARRICAERGWNPDTCVFGSGSVSHDGKGQNVCHVYMWQNCLPEARAAIQALPLADEFPAEWRAMLLPLVEGDHQPTPGIYNSEQHARNLGEM